MPAAYTLTMAFKSKKARIAYLKTIGNEIMYGLRKEDSINFIKIFHDGIQQSKFALEKLSELTIQRKKSQGMKSPRIPLFGRGDDKKKNSFMNMLRVRKLKNGWKVFPSWGKHHKSNLQLRQLLSVHEYGRTIKRGNGFIKIPARPVFRLTNEKFLKYYKKKNEEKNLSRAIAEFINKGRSEYIKKYIKINNTPLKDLQE